MRAELDSQLGGWKLIGLVDSGGNGEVWKAEHDEHGEGAVKILHAFDDNAKLQRRTSRFNAEVERLQALPELGVPGVMPLLDSGVRTDGRPWFAMPLADALDPPTDRVPWATAVVRSVAETLVALHREGIVHRDVKPANILVLDGEIVLSDFGLSRSIDDDHLTTTGEQVGSHRYVAPECLTKSDEPQFSCDVYSLSKTAWVLLTGEEYPPAGGIGDHVADALEMFGVDQAPAFQALLESGTSRDPLDRPTMRQFLDALVARDATPFAGDKAGSKSASGPATRASSLFRDEAATNRRRQEVHALSTEIAALTGQILSVEWAEIAAAIGWARLSSNGGGYGQSQKKHLNDGWEMVHRYFGSGILSDETFNIACTTRRKPFNGTRTLTIGVSIAIEWGAVAESQDRVIADKVFEGFSSEPSSSGLRESVADFLNSDEIKYRTVEALKELSASAWHRN